jgi:hypothetical protein
MAGTRWTARIFLAVLAGFAGTLGMVLLALLPVSWLFSASSRHLATAMVFQFLLWLVTLALARKFLRQALARPLLPRLATGDDDAAPRAAEKARRRGLRDRQEAFLEQMFDVFDQDETVSPRKPPQPATTPAAVSTPCGPTKAASPAPAAPSPVATPSGPPRHGP